MDTDPPISWREPWHPVRDASQRRGLQQELDKELSPAHPLWNTGATVFGQHPGSDDILVALRDGRFAMVHLVWHSSVDQYPDKFPYTVLYEDVAALQRGMEEEFADWE